MSGYHWQVELFWWIEQRCNGAWDRWNRARPRPGLDWMPAWAYSRRKAAERRHPLPAVVNIDEWRSDWQPWVEQRRRHAEAMEALSRLGADDTVICHIDPSPIPPTVRREEQGE